MNRKLLWSGFVAVVVIVAATGIYYLLQPKNSEDLLVVDEKGNTFIDDTVLRPTLSDMAQESLSELEIQGLLYMREEEKLAWDVYLTLYEKWNIPIFENIASAEQSHTTAVLTLIQKYELDDPYISERGQFSNSELQELYDTLVAEGSKSLQDALKVGAAIEEIDILDLNDYLAQTNNKDITLVYENLMKGSRNHLRAFVKTLKNNGVQYTPHYLSQEDYDAIISSPTEKGGPMKI